MLCLGLTHYVRQRKKAQNHGEFWTKTLEQNPKKAGVWVCLYSYYHMLSTFVNFTLSLT
jgi:hypothetical protein